MSAIGTALGEVRRWLDAPGRRRAEERLAAALPHLSAAQRQRAARLTFRHRERARVRELSMRGLSDVELCQRSSLAGWEHLSRVSESGRGAIAVVLPLGLEGLARRALRLYRSATVIEPGGESLLQAVRRLEARGTVVTELLPVPGLSTPLRTPFFEDEALLSDLPGRLAHETGAAIVPIHALAAPQGIRVKVGGPIAPHGTIETITRELAARVELAIGATPELWPWERALE